MSTTISWKVTDFCRHFGVEAPVNTAAISPATAHQFFHHLVQKCGIAVDAAAARLRVQNTVEGILQEEGLEDDGAIALDILQGQPTAANAETLREYAVRFLHDRRRLAGAEPPAGKEAGRMQVPAERRQRPRLPEVTGPGALWKALVSMEADLFSTAVELSRRSDELDERETALAARMQAVEAAEAELRQNTSAREQDVWAMQADVGAQQASLLVKTAVLEERRAHLAQTEAALDARATETRREEEALAAERVALQSARATLVVEQAALEQDRRQCEAVAHGFVDRERRLKAAEAMLARAKDDLTAYERSLTLVRGRKSTGKGRGKERS
ncbi:hypothetical protein TraAM80_04182 [Trypanosoma rangeli]|uniref:Uncharacterized protein n=1 Tax=Trypanosoma rangeli TaxID=5698 RepID=A0A422NKI1_TRYRA|nr:uncharacterized protein TraAM80_04182 [Trypanosoma rangeli]RNF06028.1 hypothetical protein TraAM80_04182 [Trypanosoma rangeli]|eukprot:RNF06028.1 hypothetical protein TraAM80_04182 [Trypanosoma rangeli]